MLTAKKFKDLGVNFVDGDKMIDPYGIPYTYKGSSLWKGWFTYKMDFFAWRPLSTLPDNPKFKCEVSTDYRSWRPLLDQSEVIKSRDELVSKLKSLSGEFKHYEDDEIATPKPVFTQAMADAGELPPVGSIFLYCNLAKPKESDWHKVESKYVDSDCMFFKGEGGIKGFVNIGDMPYAPCKPIDTHAPKQKAIDDIDAERDDVANVVGVIERMIAAGYHKDNKENI